MSRKVLVAIAAAVALGAIGQAGPAKATPLAPAAQSQAQFDRSMVVPVKKHKAKHHKHRPRVTFGVTIPGAAYPGFYHGSYYHPYAYIDQGAPYHCHRWRDQFGLRQELCHRHW